MSNFLMLSVLYCEGSFISSHSESLPKTMYVERGRRSENQGHLGKLPEHPAYWNHDFLLTSGMILHLYAGPRVAVWLFALRSKGFLFAFPWKCSPPSPGFIWGFSVWCKSGLHLEFLMLVQLSEWRLGVPRGFSGALKGKFWPWGSLLPRCPTLISFTTPVKSSHFSSVFWNICKGHSISSCYLFSR